MTTMCYSTKRRPRHAVKTGDRRSPVLTTVTSAVLAASIAAGIGAGAASAVEQGGTSPGDTAPEQGGTTPGQSTPEQGGTTPTPPPAPAPPANVPGPGSIPGPPQEAPYVPYGQEQSAPQYEDAYNPVPNGPLTAPKRVAPVRPIAPPENKIRVGNFVTPIPQGMNKRDVNSINAWSAFGEAKIAQNLIAIGVPKDKASRQAASTIIGVMIGGTAGAVALGIPTAIAGAAVGLPIGAVVGAGVGVTLGAIATGTATLPTGLGAILGAILAGGPGAASGALIGAVAGPVVGGLGGAALGGATGAVIGGAVGGALAYALGAGDPGANPDAPWEKGRPKPQQLKPLPNPGGNQFELHLPPATAKNSGLPAVDYVVNVRGDVEGNVGGHTFGWSVEQAMAPYGVLGLGAENAARQLTRQGTAQLQSAVPGIQVLWPQEIQKGR